MELSVESISQKINQSPMMYLPAIYQKIMEFHKKLEKLDGKNNPVVK